LRALEKEVFYYYNDNGINAVSFWEQTIKQFIDNMIVEKGSWASGYTPIHETQTHFYTLYSAREKRLVEVETRGSFSVS
jgi:hypothetical protein